MTPLERSRFAADSAISEEAQPLGPAGSARQWVDQTRESIRSHHGWTSGLGDCAADCKTCCAVCFCQPVVVGQLIERVYRRKWSCLLITVLLALGASGNLFATWYEPPCEKVYDMDHDGELTHEELNADANGDGMITTTELVDKVSPYYDCQQDFYTSGRFIAASVLGVLFVVSACCLTMLVRAHVRKRDSIPVTICSGLDDCICAALCMSCVQCQILRHEGLVEGRYRLLSPDASTTFGGLAQMV